MKRAAVYNQYWATGGGGETFCGGIAQALAEDGYEVTLLTDEEFDAERLGERLRLDLGACAQRVAHGAAAVSAASADYDLFVNGSYLSNAANRAAIGIYVVHFPGSRPPARWYDRLARLVPEDRLSLPLSFVWGEGFHAPDPGAGGSIWTSSEASLRVSLDDGAPPRLQLIFGHLRPPEVGPAHVEVLVDGEVRASGSVPAAAGGLRGRIQNRTGTVIDVPLPPSGTAEIAIRSSAFVPADEGLGNDRRELGVPLRGVTVGSATMRLLASLLPGVYQQVVAQGTPGVVSSYDVVASNSAFTARFVEDWWSIDQSPVLYPPVALREPSATKDKRIVAVGRFFDADSGHSKKQIELVRAFRRLRARGVDGWTLTFVGGCDATSKAYLDRVRAEAEGLPVEFRIDATGAERDQAIAAASLFWHATGMGEDPERQPDRMEHFGISTVEAMSTGAVPVVFGAGGQLEIVEHGVSGYHFRDLDELVGYSRRLIDHPDELERMSRAAATRALAFGLEAFRPRLREIIAHAANGGAS